ncbi:hypothetical protein vBYpPT3_00030 [Yersinia phage vB_YpP_T3]|uniref:Uncharacterized protein n=1 Tax=Yersinia phage vB_YpP_T3 TaxID=2736204 RepID=A0A7D3QJN8_9CAUD|nr:hypothetical protein vBYpPT3_00030 [Yersinia phage vB_YpP_T3]
MWILTMGLHATNAVCITTVEYTTKEKAEAAGALWFSIRGEEK